MQADVQVINAGEDRPIAIRIAERLRNNGLDVWMDLEALASGITLVSSVESAIRNCRVVVYICSEATEQEQWAVEGVAVESTLQRQFRELGHVGPAVISVRVDDTELSPRLAHQDYIDIRDDDFDDQMSILLKRIQERLNRRKVFVSHSSRDKEKVNEIVEQLREDDALDIWYDNDALHPGMILRRNIESGIQSADYLVVVMSQNAIDTLDGWIGFELDQAYEIERERNQLKHYFAIPVLLEAGIKPPGWLGTKVHVDLERDFTEGLRRLVAALKLPIPVR
ncbi:MAG: toll/interleukin-1 receptor domain-containing protein [Planctomycetaceae bacterium]|nr:toll/interleukin-1 receptor domain-containing protein [Planctomycetaceae bacterium]MCB9951679.1 toll/interleukin-1 receptor domain-containing protein [Planctomycetaceae bacterium]